MEESPSPFAPQKIRESFPLALFVALAPVYAYGTAYVYELHYARQFGLPTEFLTVDLALVLAAAAGIAAVMFPIWLLLHYVPVRHVRILLPRLMIPTLAATATVVVTRVTWLFWMLFVGTAVVLWLEWLRPLSTRRAAGGFWERWEAENKAMGLEFARVFDASVVSKSYDFLISYGIDFRLVYPLYLIALVSYAAASFAGSTRAMQARDFPAFTYQANEYLLVRRWGTILLAVPYDTVGRDPGPNVLVLPVNDPIVTRWVHTEQPPAARMRRLLSTLQAP